MIIGFYLYLSDIWCYLHFNECFEISQQYVLESFPSFAIITAQLDLELLEDVSV